MVTIAFANKPGTTKLNGAFQLHLAHDESLMLRVENDLNKKVHELS